MAETNFIVGAALDGAGWHPAAWREPSAQPTRLFEPDYWVESVKQAQAGTLDFVTFEDSFALQAADRFEPDRRTDEVRGRLDARLIASRVAPVTQNIGLIPVVNTTLTEPFHQSKAIATLDFTSHGRAGFQARVGSRGEEFSQLGLEDTSDLSAARASAQSTHRADQEISEQLSQALRTRFDQGADEVRAIRALWDSWEDGAEIRDVATDRFIDADKLHTVDFETESFSIRGPSITPRPPQGQPVVAALAHAEIPYEFAAEVADLVFVTPTADSAADILAAVRAAETKVGRTSGHAASGTGNGAGAGTGAEVPSEPLRVIADLVVLLDETAGTDGPTGESAADRLKRLDALGRSLADATEARIVAGSAAQVAETIAQLAELGYDGVRLRPAVLTDDLPRIAGDLVPALREHGLARQSYPANPTLRELVGLPTDVPSRYAGQTGRISPAPASAL